MLGSHFHDQITRQALSSPLPIIFGVVVFAVALDVSRRMRRRLLIGFPILLAVGGTYRLVGLPALQHNHLCHAHGSDWCDSDHRRDGHTHWYWFGGRAAKPRPAADWVRFAPPPAHQTSTTPPIPPPALSTQTTGPPLSPGCVPPHPQLRHYHPAVVSPLSRS